MSKSFPFLYHRFSWQKKKWSNLEVLYNLYPKSQHMSPCSFPTFHFHDSKFHKKGFESNMPPNSFTLSLVAVVTKEKKKRERERGQWVMVVLEGLSRDILRSSVLVWMWACALQFMLENWFFVHTSFYYFTLFFVHFNVNLLYFFIHKNRGGAAEEPLYKWNYFLTICHLIDV